jgi:hypothetical protein
VEGINPALHWEELENHEILNMTFFWDIAPCIVVEIDRRFKRSLPPPSSGR